MFLLEPPVCVHKAQGYWNMHTLCCITKTGFRRTQGIVTAAVAVQWNFSCEMSVLHFWSCDITLMLRAA